MSMKKTCEYLSSLREAFARIAKGTRNSTNERVKRNRKDKCCPMIRLRVFGGVPMETGTVNPVPQLAMRRSVGSHLAGLCPPTPTVGYGAKTTNHFLLQPGTEATPGWRSAQEPGRCMPDYSKGEGSSVRRQGLRKAPGEESDPGRQPASVQSSSGCFSFFPIGSVPSVTIPCQGLELY
jgi:hypothetical protein